MCIRDRDSSSDITALTLDMSAAGEATFNAGIVIADAGNIGSASDKDAIAISSGGVVTMNQIPVFSAGINVSGGSIAGTLSTAAQTNITSLGTLTTLTVDNVITNGTTIGHTDDTDLITLADGIVTVAGEISVTTLDIGGTNVTSTASELNLLDGGTSVGGSITLADADGIVTNDGGTMKTIPASDIKTFVGAGAGAFSIANLDIDGGTDIGADLADADLIVVDDGAGGTNRKSAMSRVKSYVLGGGAGATFAAIKVSGIGTVAYVDATQLKVSGISTFTGQTNHSTINASSTVTGTAFHTGAEGSAIRVTSNTISGPATITLDPAGVGDNTGKVTIAGDLQVDGTTTTVNSTTMTVDDKNLELGTGAANDAAANGGGITIVSGEGNKTFQFEATGDNLGSSENVNVASGKAYKVNNVSVLNATTLGSSVVASSLTSVGNLTTLDVTGATNLNATTQSTSNTTGALIVDGGVGIAKNAHIGGTLDVDGQLTSAAPLRNSTGAGLIPGVGVITATSDAGLVTCLLYTSPSPRDATLSRMPSSA